MQSGLQCWDLGTDKLALFLKITPDLSGFQHFGEWTNRRNMMILKVEVAHSRGTKFRCGPLPGHARGLGLPLVPGTCRSPPVQDSRYLEVRSIPRIHCAVSCFRPSAHSHSCRMPFSPFFVLCIPTLLQGPAEVSPPPGSHPCSPSPSLLTRGQLPFL